MRRIVKEEIVPRMWNDNGDLGASAADPVELLHDAEIDVRRLAEMLEHVGEQYLFDGVVRPRPRQMLQIGDFVRLAGRHHVDVVPTRHPLVATAEIKLHLISALTSRLPARARD